MKEKSWQLLNIDKTTDKAVIRQAYRAELPLYHPETDPEGFKALREAYEYAMHYADLPEIDNDLLFAPQADETVEALSPEQQAVNQICLDYQMLLNDPERRYHIEQWHQFVGSFYDYPMAIIDLARWPLLEISYDASYLSFECTKVLADSLRWRQQLMTQSAEKVDYYDEFLNQIERGDYFDYSSLPTTNKVIQNVTLDYIYTLRWLFWERPTDELHYGLSQDTVIYLPDNSELMLKFANWYCAGRVANAALLDYALLYIEKKDIDAQTIIEWKYVVACQYSLMDDKEHALQSWLALYNSGHYQEKAISWLIYWCSMHSPKYLPLLIVAVNESLCMPVDTTEAQFFTIPHFSPTTIIRLAKLRKDAYSPEIMDFVIWASSHNWLYRRVLSLLLCDDGHNRLFRLYRHAVMLRHGNETLLQAIIDDDSEDPFERFILQNLQRQAQQNLTWLKGLEPVQEFKMWLYDEDQTVTIPQKFIPQSENNQYYFARMWLDRFRDLPLISQIRLYNNVNYSDMEMFDWPVCLEVKDYCHLPTPPDTSILAQDKTVYWQWYRHCMLIISLVIEPAKAAKYIKQDVDTFKLPVNSPIFSLFETIKQSDWQDETQLYSIINNNNKLTNCILSSYPDSIEYFIENPENIDFDNICQKVDQMWQPKLANSNPVYLMLLMTILLNKSDKKTELNQALQKIAGDSVELQKVKKSLQENWTYPFSKKNDNYNFNSQADQIVKLAERLANYYGLCDEDDILMLSTIKDDFDNDLVLRLCAALLLAKNIENQKVLEARKLPKNNEWQFWRWNGRTSVRGCVFQIYFIFFVMWFVLNFVPGIKEIDGKINMLIILGSINVIFAIKRRLNDTYNGARFFFTSRILCMPIIMFPCWSKGLLVTNRYGRPVDK